MEAARQRSGGKAAPLSSLSAPPNGYRICLLFLKLFDKIYAPLTAGLLHPYPGDRTMTDDRLHQLDQLYQSVAAALDELVTAVGLKLAA